MDRQQDVIRRITAHVGAGMTENNLKYLEECCARARETRKSLLGYDFPTSKAEAARTVLAVSVPALIQEIKELRSWVDLLENDRDYE